MNKKIKLNFTELDSKINASVNIEKIENSNKFNIHIELEINNLENLDILDDVMEKIKAEAEKYIYDELFQS